jgi:hypothetical protein
MARGDAVIDAFEVRDMRADFVLGGLGFVEIAVGNFERNLHGCFAPVLLGPGV